LANGRGAEGAIAQAGVVTAVAAKVAVAFTNGREAEGAILLAGVVTAVAAKVAIVFANGKGAEEAIAWAGVATAVAAKVAIAFAKERVPEWGTAWTVEFANSGGAAGTTTWAEALTATADASHGKGSCPHTSDVKPFFLNDTASKIVYRDHKYSRSAVTFILDDINLKDPAKHQILTLQGTVSPRTLTQRANSHRLALTNR
jgi:hypothetical protein